MSREERRLYRRVESDRKYIPTEMQQDEIELRSRMDLLKKQIEEAEALFKQYQEQCAHTIFHFDHGVQYTIRYCGICDKPLEKVNSAIL
jgi:hypothetical protein